MQHIRRITVAVAAAAALAGTGLAASAASASTAGQHLKAGSTKVVVNTDSYGHMDTTNVSGTATFQEPSGGGPVWAIDTLRERWTVVPCSANAACDSTDGANYYVTLNVGPKIDGGSRFSEFANPGPNDPANGITSTCPAASAGDPRLGTGSVTGTISYSVVSNAGPDLSSVPAVQAPNTSLGTVLSQIFDQATNFSTVGATPYTFSYANVCGSVYSQTG